LVDVAEGIAFGGVFLMWQLQETADFGKRSGSALRRILMTRTSWLFCGLAVFAVAPGMAAAANIAAFVDFSLRSASNQVLLPGRLYVPPESLGPSAGPRPLMMYLHGAAANGNDNSAQVAEVKDRMLTEAIQRGAFLYVPQAINTWSTRTITDRVMTMIDRAIDELNANTNRVYITGFSQGSVGTWLMLSRYSGRFAAGMPLSGGTTSGDFVGARLIDTPIFALHSRNDGSASVTVTRNNINSILAAANVPRPTYLTAGNPSTFFISNLNIECHRPIREAAHQQGSTTDFLIPDPALDLMYYEPAGGGHTGTVGAYHAPEVYEWLFAHTTAVPEAGTASLLLIGLVSFGALGARRYSGVQA
jgi:predicted peptidase